MATKTVTTMPDTADLESDISELEGKLNGVIDEFNKITTEWTDFNKVVLDALKTQFNLAESDITSHATLINSLKTQYNNAESDITSHATVISEIKTTVNALKTDMGTNKTKINQLIADVGAFDTQINGNYTADGSSSGGGSSSDPILSRLKTLHDDVGSLDARLENHREIYGGDSAHPGNPPSAGGGGTGGGGGGDGMEDLDETTITASGSGADSATAVGGTPANNSTAVSGTASDDSNAVSGTASDDSNAVTNVSSDDSTATANAEGITGSYGTDAVHVLAIGATTEKRARQLARKTLNRLR